MSYYSQPVRSLALFFYLLGVTNTALYAQDKLSLGNAYTLAIKNTESSVIQESKTKQLEEKTLQARAAILPHVSLDASYQKEEVPAGSKVEGASHDVKIHATQSLFHGGKEFYAINVANFDHQSQQDLEKLNKLNLYAQISQAFFSILSGESDLKNLDEQLQIMNSRIKELRERVAKGKSRKADLLTTESQKASILAQIDAAKVQLQGPRETLKNLIGVNKDFSLVSPFRKLPELKNISDYLQKIESRPDVHALERQIDSSSEQIAIAKSGHLPSLDLGSNYYLNRSDSVKTPRWDIGLTFSLPLYEGGSVTSQVTQVVEHKTEQTLTLAQTKKSAEKDIKTLYESIKGNKAQFESLNIAIKRADDAYQEQLRDYRYGMATLLDVLQMQNNLLDSKKTLERVRYQICLNYIQLMIAVNDVGGIN